LKAEMFLQTILEVKSEYGSLWCQMYNKFTQLKLVWWVEIPNV